jgi:NADPH-dependent 2,4-dienoyl-CoA reductase/sulfur reductase-like enzyme
MDVVIIGNGISGITAARWIRKLSDGRVTVISSESKYFYSRTALMYIYMGHMRHEDTKPYEDWFWDKNNIDLLYGHVDAVNFKEKSICLKSGKIKAYDKLIIATGSKSNKFGWPGQDLDAVTGLYNLRDLAIMEKYSTGLDRAVIVGGGLIGIEMAEMFHSRKIPVTMLVRETNYWDNVLPLEEAQMVAKHILEHHIDLRLNVNLQEIIDDGNGKAEGVIVKETGEKIPCGFVGLTPGVSPNIEFLKGSGLEVNRGVLVDKYLNTNIPDVYAIGDCAELKEPPEGRKPIEAVWYTGRMMGETCAYTICGKPIVYNPGIWFNSAKFLDIEYQVYGNVPNVIDGELDSILWQNEEKRLSVRIVFNKKLMQVEGFNLLGIRYRHEVCEKWLHEKTHMDDVMKNLALANFDPEFYRSYESQIIDVYNRKIGRQVSSQSKRGLQNVLKYLSPNK